MFINTTRYNIVNNNDLYNNTILSASCLDVTAIELLFNNRKLLSSYQNNYITSDIVVALYNTNIQIHLYLTITNR